MITALAPATIARFAHHYLQDCGGACLDLIDVEIRSSHVIASHDVSQPDLLEFDASHGCSQTLSDQALAEKLAERKSRWRASYQNVWSSATDGYESRMAGAHTDLIRGQFLYSENYPCVINLLQYRIIAIGFLKVVFITGISPGSSTSLTPTWAGTNVQSACLSIYDDTAWLLLDFETETGT